MIWLQLKLSHEKCICVRIYIKCQNSQKIQTLYFLIKTEVQIYQVVELSGIKLGKA